MLSYIVKTFFFTCTLMLMGCNVVTSDEVSTKESNVSDTNDYSQTSLLSKDANPLVLATNVDAKHYIDLVLKHNPLYLLNSVEDNQSVWMSVGDDGSVQVYKNSDDGYKAIRLNVDKIAKGMPPLLAKNSLKVRLINSEFKDISPESSAFVVDENESYYVDNNGILVAKKAKSVFKLDINAMLDTQIVASDDYLLLLSNPTSKYTHGALGDSVEAQAICIVEYKEKFALKNCIKMKGESVIEGLYPIVVHVENREYILVTLSNNKEASGAKLVLFDFDGNIVAESELSPGGWRHQLGVLYRDDNKMLILNVQKPHVDKIIQFYEKVGNRLVVKYNKKNISTHTYGSKNLSKVLIGNFDENSTTREVLVPDAQHANLILLDEKATYLKSFKGCGFISTNISLQVHNKKTSIAIGCNGVLRIWE